MSLDITAPVFQNGIWPYKIYSLLGAKTSVDTVITKLEPGGCFKNTYELLNPRALKIWTLYKKIFCVEFQRFPLKFHTKYLTHTLKYADFIHRWKFKGLDLRAHKCFWKAPLIHLLKMDSWWVELCRSSLSSTWSCLNIKTIFPDMGISIIKIRQSWDCLIFIMGAPILVRRHLYIETGPIK